MSLKVYGLGRLSKEPELRFTQSNKEVVSVDMAFDRGFGDSKATDFIPVVFWGEKAKAVSQYTRKGDRLLIEGEVQVRKWQTKEGENRYTTEVRCLEFAFIESSKRDTIEQPFYEEQQEVTPDNFMGDTDDLPF